MYNYILLCVLLLIFSCTKQIQAFNPNKKYAPVQLQKDFSIFKESLERYHPSLYWYTEKNVIDSAFMQAYTLLQDSLTEPQFRRVLASVTAQVRCGHTSVQVSKKYAKYVDTLKTLKTFPFVVKLCNDTVVYIAALTGKDSLLKRGTIVTAINNKLVRNIIDTMFRFLSTDGFNTTHKYQALSNGTYFGSMFNALYGVSDSYSISYLDSSLRVQSVTIPAFSKVPVKRKMADSVTHLPKAPSLPLTKKQVRERKLQAIRKFTIDSSITTGIITLNGFSRNGHLRSFFKKMFKTANKKSVPYLIIDVRNNGGGLVSLSNTLTRYIADHSFKLADSLYGMGHISRHKKYVQQHVFTNMFISFLAHKKKDGYRHISFYEEKYFKPKKRDGYKGNVIVLTGGNSFSATTLFAHAIQHQKNITLVGEETGGGSYGNTAIIIPWVTLPVTKVKFRLPLFRLVMDSTAPKTGTGIQPHVFATYTVSDIRKGTDVKMDKARSIIKEWMSKKN